VPRKTIVYAKEGLAALMLQFTTKKLPIGTLID
jgi:hypothetical protein